MLFALHKIHQLIRIHKLCAVSTLWHATEHNFCRNSSAVPAATALTQPTESLGAKIRCYRLDYCNCPNLKPPNNICKMLNLVCVPLNNRKLLSCLSAIRNVSCRLELVHVQAFASHQSASNRIRHICVAGNKTTKRHDDRTSKRLCGILFLQKQNRTSRMPQ